MLRCVLDKETLEPHTEMGPAVFGHNILPVGGSLQTPDLPVDKAEIIQYPAELGAHPQRTDQTVVVLEDKDAVTFFREVTGGLDHSHQGIFAAVTIYITCAEPIYRIGYLPLISGGIGG